MPFFIILTAIPSTKVVFFKSKKLAKSVKNRGSKDKRRNKNE
jgi:hypothetical protein